MSTADHRFSSPRSTPQFLIGNVLGALLVASAVGASAVPPKAPPKPVAAHADSAAGSGGQPLSPSGMMQALSLILPPGATDAQSAPPRIPAASKEAKTPRQAEADAAAQKPEPGLRIITHTIAEGETLWSIAEKYGTDVDSLVAINDLERANLVSPGQQLRVLVGGKGIVYAVEPGDTVSDLAHRFEVAEADILKANQLKDDTIQAGQELIIPNAAPRATRFLVASRAAARGERSWIWPAYGTITSPFGPRWGRHHGGIDIAASDGSEVVASRTGRVIYSGWDGDYGLVVRLDHGGGVTSVYGHLSRALVSVGERVAQGQSLGLVGSTGFSTGPHLHFEIREDGQVLNPANFLP